MFPGYSCLSVIDALAGLNNSSINKKQTRRAESLKGKREREGTRQGERQTQTCAGSYDNDLFFQRQKRSGWTEFFGRNLLVGPFFPFL